MLNRICFCLSAVCLLISHGCSSPPVDSPVDKSEELREAVSAIDGLHIQIRDGFEAGDVDAAHDPLHQIGTQLEGLTELAEQSGRSKEETEAIKADVEILFESFGSIDKTLHGQEGSTYEEEATTIADAMKRLMEVCSK